MPSLKLYYYPPTRSERARWALEEAGAEYEGVLVNRFTNETQKPEYLAVNPLGKLPALSIDGRIVTESAAIVLHILDLYPDNKLAPAVGSPERAAYYQWVVFGPAELDHYLATITGHALLLPEDQRKPELIRAAQEQFAKRAAVIAKALEGKEYLVGDAFSGADISVGHSLAWADILGLIDANPILKPYYERLSARPAFQKVFAKALAQFKPAKA